MYAGVSWATQVSTDWQTVNPTEGDHSLADGTCVRSTSALHLRRDVGRRSAAGAWLPVSRLYCWVAAQSLLLVPHWLHTRRADRHHVVLLSQHHPSGLGTSQRPSHRHYGFHWTTTAFRHFTPFQVIATTPPHTHTYLLPFWQPHKSNTVTCYVSSGTLNSTYSQSVVYSLPCILKGVCILAGSYWGVMSCLAYRGSLTLTT